MLAGRPSQEKAISWAPCGSRKVTALGGWRAVEPHNFGVDRLVESALEAMGRQDWDRLHTILHPTYVGRLPAGNDLPRGAPPPVGVRVRFLKRRAEAKG